MGIPLLVKRHLYSERPCRARFPGISQRVSKALANERRRYICNVFMVFSHWWIPECNLIWVCIQEGIHRLGGREEVSARTKTGTGGFIGSMQIGANAPECFVWKVSRRNFQECWHQFSLKIAECNHQKIPLVGKKGNVNFPALLVFGCICLLHI